MTGLVTVVAIVTAAGVALAGRQLVLLAADLASAAKVGVRAGAWLRAWSPWVRRRCRRTLQLAVPTGGCSTAPVPHRASEPVSAPQQGAAAVEHTLFVPGPRAFSPGRGGSGPGRCLSPSVAAVAAPAGSALPPDRPTAGAAHVLD
jgi:hypothetical protein